jgi:hypothetical protein
VQGKAYTYSGIEAMLMETSTAPKKGRCLAAVVIVIGQ